MNTKTEQKPKKKPVLDLSMFDNPTGMPDKPHLAKNNVATPKNQINVVLLLPLDKVIEDPDQPRTEFKEDEVQELAQDIELRGVQQPILVRPANAQGLYQIIHGARRYRASKIASQDSIKAIVESDEQLFDDYSQVAENIKRASLSPMDLARFIKKRVDAGDKQKDIAKKLGLTIARVSESLSLMTAPPEIQEAIVSGRVTDTRTAYELTKLAEKNPDKASELLNGEKKISRSMLSEEKKSTPAVSTKSKIDEVNQDKENEAQHQDKSNEDGSDEPSELDDESMGEDESKITHVPYHNPELDKKDTGSVMVRDPSKVSRPLILGQVKDPLGEVRGVKVVWSKLATPGMVNIQWEDTMIEESVVATSVTLTLVSVMKQQEK